MNLDDIFDMYLLKIQGKLNNLPGGLQYDIVNSLLLFIRTKVIRARVEDAQLGAESYQQRLNFTEPMMTSFLANKRPLSFVDKPFGVVYAKTESHKFMRYTEIHKFGDQTLKHVLIKLEEGLKRYKKREAIHWRTNDARSARKFIDIIQAKLRYREQIRRLESIIGGREPIPNILTYRRP